MKSFRILKVKPGRGDYANRWFVTVTDGKRTGVIVMTVKQFYTVLENSAILDEGQVITTKLRRHLVGGTITGNIAFHTAGTKFTRSDNTVEEYRKDGFHFVNGEVLDTIVEYKADTEEMLERADRYVEFQERIHAGQTYAREILANVSIPEDINDDDDDGGDSGDSGANTNSESKPKKKLAI